MARPNFVQDIAVAFKPYVEPMLQIQIPDEDGVAALDLSDYASVKRFHRQIETAIKGYGEPSETFDPDSDEPGRWPASSHPMPPRPDGPLPLDTILAFEKWVRIGMPKDDNSPVVG